MRSILLRTTRHLSSRSRLSTLLQENNYAERDYAARLTACKVDPAAVTTFLRSIFECADPHGTGSLELAQLDGAITSLKEACPLSRAALLKFMSPSLRWEKIAAPLVMKRSSGHGR